MWRDRLPANLPDLAKKFAEFEMTYLAWRIFSGAARGWDGVGWTRGCQDSFLGLVGPFRPTGRQFGAIFHIFLIFRRVSLAPHYFLGGWPTGGTKIKNNRGAAVVIFYPWSFFTTNILGPEHFGPKLTKNNASPTWPNWPDWASYGSKWSNDRLPVQGFFRRGQI